MANLIQIPGLTEGTNKSYFVKKTKNKTKPNQKTTTKTHPDYRYQKLSETDIIKMLEFFLLTIYLVCLVDMFSNRQSVYLCVQTVLLLSPTNSYIRSR